MYYLAKRDYNYAFRICASHANLWEKVSFTIQHLASRLLIPKPYATKIVFLLKKSAIFEIMRGKNGGVSLAVSPLKTTIYNIFNAVGKEIQISACISEEGFCPLPAPCKIHRFFIERELINKLNNIRLNNFAFSDDDI